MKTTTRENMRNLLDEEWTTLIWTAQRIGVTPEEVRGFLRKQEISIEWAGKRTSSPRKNVSGWKIYDISIGRPPEGEL